FASFVQSHQDSRNDCHGALGFCSQVHLSRKESTSAMDLQNKAIQRFRRHLAILFVLKYALPLATLWSFLCGTAVLVLRAAAGVERKPLLWGLIGLAGCLAAALTMTRRRMPTTTAIRALLDEQSG